MTTHPSILIVLFNQHSAERASYVSNKIPSTYNCPTLFIESETVPASSTNNLFSDLNRLTSADKFSLEAGKSYLLPFKHLITSTDSAFRVEKAKNNISDEGLSHIVSTLHTMHSVDKITVILCHDISDESWKSLTKLKSQEKSTAKITIAALISPEDSVEWITSRLKQNYLSTIFTKENANSFFHAQCLSHSRNNDSLEFQLGERVKELRTLYQISQLNEQKLSYESLLKQAARILKSGFIDPPHTEIQIVSSNAVGQTEQFPNTDTKSTSARVSNTYYQGYPILIKARLSNQDLKIIPEEIHLMQGVADLLALKMSRVDTLNKLRSKQNRLQRIFDESLDLIATVKKDDAILTVNAISEEILGYKPSEMTGHRALEFLAEGEEEALNDFKAALVREKHVVDVRIDLLHKDGHRVPIIWSSTFDPKSDIFYLTGKDATEIVRTQNKLKKSEERSRLLLSHITDVITICDKNGNVTYQSPSLRETLGYEPGYMIGKNITTLIHPDDFPTVWESFQETLQIDGVGPRVSFRALHQKGHHIYLESQANNQINNPEVQSVIISSRDITEEKKQEKQLKDSADQYKSLFNNSPIAKFVLDSKSLDILDVNRAALLQYHYSKKEFYTFSYPSLHASGSEIDFQLEEFASRQQSDTDDTLNTHFGIFRQHTKNYGWIFADISVHHITYQSRPAIMIACVDVTEREQTLMQLRDRESKLTQAQYIAKLGYWELSLVTNRFVWSDEVYQIWNKNRSDFIPTVSFFNSHIHPDDAERYKNHKNEVIRDHSEIDIKFRILTDDQGEKWLHHRAQPVFGPLDNHPIAYEGTTQDITEFEQAQQQSRKDEARLLAIAKSQTNYVIRTDMEGIYTYANDKFLNEYAWLHKDEEVIGKSGMISILEEDHPKTNEVVHSCINEPGKVFQVELRKPGKNGKNRITFWDFICITGHNGQPSEIQAVGIDITDLKHAQQELEKAYEENDEIIESISDGFFVLDEDFNVTYWNQSATEILDVSRDDIVGKNLFEVFPSHKYNNYKRHYLRALKKHNQTQFEQFISENELWIEVNLYPKRNGIAVHFKDITERKKYEKKLEEANERFEIVIDASNDAIWEWNLETGEHLWGSGFYKLFGYNSDTLEISAELWKDLVLQEDRERVVNHLYSSIDNPEIDSVHDEYRFKKADGNWADVSENATIIRDTKGTPLRIIGTMQDITNRKEYERSLKTLNDQLGKSVQELADSNKDLEHFAYVASHDLQEPLRMITGFLEQLKRKYGDQLDETAQTYIRFSVDGASRMRQLILDLLDFSRVGRNEFEKKEIDLNNLLDDIKQDLYERIESTSATITHDKLPIIYGHSGYIQRLIQNLLSNALKYSKEDVPPEIAITAEDKDDFWEFSVKDNGIGFSMEHADKIFVIFQRLHNRDSYSGTGLGLAIAKKIVELHGGKIRVESESGNGSTFYFTIAKMKTVDE